MFPKRYCKTITDYVKANYINGKNPERKLSEFNPTYVKLYDYASYCSSIEINQSNSSFSYLNFSYSSQCYWRCMDLRVFSNDGVNADLSKVVITDKNVLMEDSWLINNGNFKTIDNLTLKDNKHTDACLLFNSNAKLEALTNIKCINANFEVSYYQQYGAYQLKTLTFKPNCTFNKVLLLVPNLTRESLLNLFNALQQLDEGDTRTCTIGTNISKLTDEDKKIATDKGWTLA